MKVRVLSLLSLILLVGCHSKMTRKTTSIKPEPGHVILGVDNFFQSYLHLVKDKRVGLLTNPSGVNASMKTTSDLLYEHDEINLTALYGPEHGIRGAIHAGDHVHDEIDMKTNLPLYSLYGKSRKPTPEMLKMIDVMLVDIQDIGLRAYTYIYTMANVMKAAAENGKRVVILDRPNPIGGIRVEGNLVEKEFESFVGLYPIPYRHGMTIGELALLFNSEFQINCQLDIVPMKGWQREMYWENTGLNWIPTSPHIPHWQSVLFCAATGMFGELGTLSEGVGYTSPFELVGAPWIDGRLFAEYLNNMNIAGVYFRPLYFRPYYLHYQGQICQGVQLHITDYSEFHPYSTGLHIMQTHMKLYPDHDLFSKPDRVKMFDKVVGTDKIRKSLQRAIPVDEIVKSWQTELNEFNKTREKYLLYRE